ncbi:MAG: 2-oxoacid:acceptor oxidoreductase family protein [Acidaminococcaceae bacterium]|nr:2-oxoacid:acceptor oxidoreductase family protein [Acidaminococcaceae bacterium]
MSKQYEFRFGGAGGQGLMLMGDIFAEAAGTKAGKEIVLTRSYGPEARGGACRSELIVSNQPINYPAVRSPHFVVAMSQQACDKYHGDIDKNGTLLIDPRFVRNLPLGVKKLYSIPMTEIAEKTTGSTLASNVVAIGATAALSGVLDISQVKQAVLDHFKPALRSSNEKAFDAGVKAAFEVMQ